MATLHSQLQHLVDSASRKPNTHSVLLGVQSHDESIDIKVASEEMAADSPYFIASIAKMFTATIVMQLVDEGQLDLDAPIRDHLPELPLDGLHVHRGTDYSSQLAIHHLLHQTSGLPDYFNGSVEEDLAQNRDRSYNVGDVLEMARRQPAKFPPGHHDGRRSFYSDTNYQLLGAIIEATTGTSLTANLQTRIVDPLGLSNTYLFDHKRPDRGPAPLPLHHKDQQLSLPLTLSSERGAGGIVSTLADQLQFLRAYTAGELFDPRHAQQMRQWNRVFFPIQYGYGLMQYKLPRWMTLFRSTPELIGHSGTTGSFAFHSSSTGLHIAGTFNQLDKPSRPFGFMLKVANLVNQHHQQQPQPALPTKEADSHTHGSQS